MKKMMMKAHKGATFIEYAMLAGLVAVVVAVAALFFGEELKGLFSETATKTQQVSAGVQNADLTIKTDKIENSTDGGSK